MRVAVRVHLALVGLWQGGKHSGRTSQRKPFTLWWLGKKRLVYYSLFRQSTPIRFQTPYSISKITFFMWSWGQHILILFHLFDFLFFPLPSISWVPSHLRKNYFPVLYHLLLFCYLFIFSISHVRETLQYLNLWIWCISLYNIL